MIIIRMKERADTDVSGEEHLEAGINKSDIRRRLEPRQTFNSDSRHRLTPVKSLEEQQKTFGSVETHDGENKMNFNIEDVFSH